MPTVDSELKPLPARSVVLSLLLGSPEHRWSPSDLTRAGEHFGIPAATLRVALTRAVASGDLARAGGDYVLGPRLVNRQQRQDEAVEDAETAWDGQWEMATVTIVGRPGPERAALRDTLTRHRLAELREGVWTRPANLRRTRGYAGDPVLTTFLATPDADPAELATALWNLPGWATEGHRLVERLDTTREPALRLSAAALLVRHLASDPLLPAPLLPADWPGTELRSVYASYQHELRALAVG